MIYLVHEETNLLCFISLHWRISDQGYVGEERLSRSIGLAMAACGGSGELFQQSLKVLEELYTDGQVCAVYILSTIKPFKIIYSFGVDIL